MTKKDKLKFLILLLLCLSNLVAFLGAKLPVWTIIISCLSTTTNGLFLLVVLLFNTIDIIKSTNNNYLYLCRMKNTNDYFHLLIKKCLKSNLTIILVSLMLNVVVSIICSSGNFAIPQNPYYSFNFLFLFGYYILKYILLYLIMPLGAIFFYNLSPRIGSFIYTCFIIIGTFLEISLPEGKAIDSILKFPIFFKNYIYIERYSPFILDVIAFALYISIWALLLSILKNICIKNRRDILG